MHKQEVKAEETGSGQQDVLSMLCIEQERLINIQYEHSGVCNPPSILCVGPAGMFASYCFNLLCSEYTPSVYWFYSEPVCLEDRQKDKSLCCNLPGEKGVWAADLCKPLSLFATHSTWLSSHLPSTFTTLTIITMPHN